MRVSNIDEYLAIEPIDDPEEWRSIHEQFPYVVVVECDFPELDVGIRWCWQNFGPRHGECQSQPHYAVCPIVLATERIEKCEVRGKEYEFKRYCHVSRHRHDGTWTTYWLGKTDYDHGFVEFCFSSEADKSQFLEFIPHVDWGENFPWLKDDQNNE